MIDISSAIRHATAVLEKTSPSARLDAEILLSHSLNKTRSYLYSHADEHLTPTENQSFQNLVNQRIQGVPIAYLTGQREFWSLPLKVTHHTLIPRPATETLVEVTLSLLKDQKDAKILDLGTGSGAIALALAKERPDWQIVACDKNEAALKIAQDNAAALGLTNIQFYQSDWFSTLPKEQYHGIVSNPPYIPGNDPHLKQGDVQFEPIDALVSGDNGLQDLSHIIHKSCNFLFTKGFLLLEHGYNQKLSVTTILKQMGYSKIQSWKDCEGHDRVSGGQR